MGYKYKYRQTETFLKNKYPENLFFCKKKIKKYNHLFEENERIIKKTKKNLLHCTFQQYIKTIPYQLNKEKNRNPPANPHRHPELLPGRWTGLHTPCRAYHSFKKLKIEVVSNNDTFLHFIRSPRFSYLSKSRIKKDLILFTTDQLFSKLLFHGSGYKRLSNFFEKLREKKKLKILYGYTNKKYLEKRYKDSTKFNGRFATASLSSFEYNINFGICRLGFYSNVRKAEQMIKHNHFLLNNKKIYSSHTEIERGDVISPHKVRGVDKNRPILYHPVTLLYKKLSLSNNKLRYRFYLTEDLVCRPKTYYLIQKLGN